MYWGEEELIFVLTFHHIILDGWSMPLLVGEVLRGYQQRLSGRPIDLPSKLPYREYIAWLESREEHQAEDFWRNYLKGIETSSQLQLPGGKKGKEGDVKRYEMSLTVEETKGLEEQAKRWGLTLNTVVQGVWSIVLSQYLQQEEVIFGVTVSGRVGGIEDIEQQIGLFINTVPIRVNVNREEKMVSFLQAIQKQMVSLQEYSHLPLAEIQRLSDASQGRSLFNTLYVFENYPVDSVTNEHVEGLSITQAYGIEKVEYPLSLIVHAKKQLGIRCQYQTTTMDEAYVVSLSEHVQQIFLSLLAQPEVVIKELPFLTSNEERQLLIEWNDTVEPYPQDKTVHQLFEEQVERTPDQVAVVFEEEQLSYRELNARANQLAHYLRKRGVKPNTLVAICLDRSLELIIGLLGILKAGGAYLPLDPSYPEARLQYMLKDSEAVLRLTSEWFKEHKQGISQKSPRNPKVINQSSDLMYVIYTSGSTGKPKGVLVAHQSISN